MGFPLTLDVSRPEAAQSDICGSPITLLTAALEARVFISAETPPPSPGLMERVHKALGDGGSDRPDYDTGKLCCLNWLFRVEVLERIGSVTDELRFLVVSCKGLYADTIQGVRQGLLRVGGRRAQLWRCLKNIHGDGNVWRDWVQEGQQDLAHLVPSSCFTRSRRALELVVGCCTQADRPDFLKELISHQCAFWNVTLCSGCTNPPEWCQCSDGLALCRTTPLALCCINDHSKCASVLLEAGAELTAAATLADGSCAHPIHLCCLNGSASTVGALCAFDKCAASMATQSDMDTPLMLAVRRNDFQTCRVLVGQPYTSIKAKNASGHTVSDMITPEHSDSLVCFLADSGAIINSLMEVRLDRRQKASIALSFSNQVLQSNQFVRSNSGFATVRSIQSLATVGSMSTVQDSAAGSEQDESSRGTSQCGSECWDSDGSSSDSDVPLSRAELKARSTDVIQQRMVPKLNLAAERSPEMLRTPRTARKNCGLPSTIARNLPGCKQSLFMQRSQRMRATFEDSSSEDDADGSAQKSSDESDCDFTPERRRRVCLAPSCVPALNL